jgi:hypothetical protein
MGSLPAAKFFDADVDVDVEVDVDVDVDVEGTVVIERMSLIYFKPATAANRRGKIKSIRSMVYMRPLLKIILYKSVEPPTRDLLRHLAKGRRGCKKNQSVFCTSSDNSEKLISSVHPCTTFCQFVEARGLVEI